MILRLVACLIWVLTSPIAGWSGTLSWTAEGGVRHAEVSPIGSSAAGFSRLSSNETGIAFSNDLPLSRYRTNQILFNGSGVAAGDVDGDGWCDVYLCALDRPNALYRNLGNGRFEDVARSAGAECAGLTSSGAVLVDFDGDGDLDLIVNSIGHGTRLFMNDGRGKFALAGVFNLNKGGMSLALGDLNGDGYLDLYVTNYRTQALMDMPNTRFNFTVVDGRRVIAKVNGRPVTEPDLANRFRLNDRGGIEENGQVDELYLNVGGTALQPVPFDGGAFVDEEARRISQPLFDWGLAVIIRDLNQDGKPDLWICNDFDSPDRFWLNQGGGRFRLAPKLALRKASHFAMGIDVADINRDGRDDVFVVDMLSRDHLTRMDMMGDRNPPTPMPGDLSNRPEHMMNVLYLNRGDGTYAEVARMAGLEATEWSWTPVFLDVDLDGFEDLLVANGNERASRSMDITEKLRALRTSRQLTSDEILDNRRMFPRQNAPNLAFHNRGDLRFEEVGRKWGFDHDGVSHGMALADLDNDGDLDVIVNNLNEPAGIYRNNSGKNRVAVRLKGRGPNTRGIGSRITVRAAGLPEQSQEVQSGGRYLSSDDPMRTFACGPVGSSLEIQVDWPGGRRSVVRNGRGNRIYEIDESAAGERPPSVAGTERALFEDATALLKHVHHEELFDDFAIQPLLPRRLSQDGPGVTWADVDGDGMDDLVIGSGKGGRIAVYRNPGGRRAFERLTGGVLDEPVSRDQTTLLAVRSGSDRVNLLAGAANYEDGRADGPMVRIVDLTAKSVREPIAAGQSSAGPLAMADVDGDGLLDLFVGGRVVPGRYPAPASSTLWRGAPNGFVRDEKNSAPLQNLGLVSSATFSDLDGDGDPDLVLGCDWGPLRILRNVNGSLTLWNPLVRINGSTNTPLGQLSGLWNGVAAGDFDGDGRMDIVASNWGRNSRYQAYRPGRVELVYGDFDGNGNVEIIESHFDATLGKLVPDRQLDYLARAMPFLRERYRSNADYGRAGVDDLLRDHAAGTKRVGVNWLESTVFLNRGEVFEAVVLPVEAQMAPSFAVCVADFNGDHNQDIFLSQNFFAETPGIPRHDGGLGLVLSGDGRGGFRALSAIESGIRIYGEQRGAAVGDFDKDGRIDLAVAQNGTETRLYRNGGGRPGIRVRLKGPPNNPDGVGAMVRLMNGDRLGPASELRAGSGYWSQDSMTLVLGTAGPVTGIWVRWPGGKITTSPIREGENEVWFDVKDDRSAPR